MSNWPDELKHEPPYGERVSVVATIKWWKREIDDYSGEARYRALYFVDTDEGWYAAFGTVPKRLTEELIARRKGGDKLASLRGAMVEISFRIKKGKDSTGVAMHPTKPKLLVPGIEGREAE